MSAKYRLVYKYYHKGLWNIQQVANAVKKGWITPEEFKMITGEDYVEESGEDGTEE